MSRGSRTVDRPEASPRRSGPVDPRLLRHARATRSFFATTAMLAVVDTAAIVAFAALVTRLVVDAIDGRDLGGTALALAAVIAVRALVVGGGELNGARGSARAGAQLRAATVDAIATLPPDSRVRLGAPRIATIAGRGLGALDAYFGGYLPQLVRTIVTTPVVLAVIWWQDWPSGLAVTLTLPLIPVFMVLIGLLTRDSQQRQWAVLQRLSVRFSDTVQGLATLRLFGRERRAAENVERDAGSFRRETMKVLRWSFLSGFALEFLAAISVAIVAVGIGLRLLEGQLSLPVGLFVLLLTPEAYLPLRAVGMRYHAAAEGVAATDDVFALLDAAAAAPAPPSPAARDPLPGSRVVRAEELRVARGERELPPVSFRARPGSVTLIAGPSGSGKSSVFAALRGAAAFTGELSLDGAALPSPDAFLAWVPQRPGLIRATVAENITLGDPALDIAHARAALDAAGAPELELSLLLGAGGSGLSGGQAQRVAVARAFYRLARGATVLALDEPSSALDPGTEAGLWREVRARADAGATVLLISHRPSAREIADEIVTIGVGR